MSQSQFDTLFLFIFFSAMHYYSCTSAIDEFQIPVDRNENVNAKWSQVDTLRKSFQEHCGAFVVVIF